MIAPKNLLTSYSTASNDELLVKVFIESAMELELLQELAYRLDKTSDEIEQLSSLISELDHEVEQLNLSYRH